MLQGNKKIVYVITYELKSIRSPWKIKFLPKNMQPLKISKKSCPQKIYHFKTHQPLPLISGRVYALVTC